jgi:glutathione synthase/RimK-type ligase-like ATP-grasp enzyme
MGERILVIGRSHHPDGKETADDIYNGLISSGRLKDHEVVLGHYNDLLFDINDQAIEVTDVKSGYSLAEFDAVLMTNWFSHASIRKDIAYSLALFWQHHKIPFFNTEALYSRSSSKLSQMMLAAINGIPIPRTIFSLSFEVLAHHTQEQIGFPAVFKSAQASRGKSNYLISSKDELVALKSQHTEIHPFIAQNFINAGQIDYRFFVAGSKTRFIIKRSGSGESHLTNTSAGASAEALPTQSMGEDVLQIVHKCSSLLHREVTGIDIMFDKNSNKPYFLEANPIPQIATGSNTERKLETLAEALIESSRKEKS